MRPFRPRHIRFDRVVELGGWRIKRYLVYEHGKNQPALDDFRQGWRLALESLPKSPVDEILPGVGFTILHQGRTALYLILSWWDHENELPTRVFVLNPEAGSWSAAGQRESFCVWDLEILWFERNAYIESYLTNGVENPREQYLARQLDASHSR